MGRSIWTCHALSPPGDPCTPRHHPGYAHPPLDPEAGLARGCGERAHPELSSNHQKSSSARRTASPPGGVFFRAAASGPPAGGRAREPAACPSSSFPLQLIGGIMAVSPAPLAGGGAFIAGAPALTPFRRNGAGHPPPPHLRPGSLWMAGGIPARHPPRSPWAPFFVFFCLPLPSALPLFTGRA
jgi:hypothetical protein